MNKKVKKKTGECKEMLQIFYRLRFGCTTRGLNPMFPYPALQDRIIEAKEM